MVIELILIEVGGMNMKRAVLFLLLIAVLLVLLTGCPDKKEVLVTLAVLAPVGQGNVDPEVGEHDFLKGVDAELSATPAEGWEFEKWEVDGEFYSGEEATTLTMDTDKTVQAFFTEIVEPPVEYTLEMLELEGQGTVDPDVGEHDYPEDTVVTLTATPAEGWEFGKWEVDGESYSDEEATTLTMDADKTVQAFFKEIVEPPVEYTLDMLEPEGKER